jgi:tetratricopeptide (TPR) repeat protein
MSSAVKGAPSSSLDLVRKNHDDIDSKTLRTLSVPIEFKADKAVTRDFDNTVADAQLQAVLNKLNNGQYQDALDLSNVVLGHEPKNATALAARALARYQLGDPDYALADANTSIKDDGKCKMAYVVRSLIQMDQGDYDGSLDTIGAGLKLGDDSELMGIAALDMFSERNIHGAFTLACDAIKLDPSNTFALNVRALAELALYDDSAALEDFDKLARARPNSSVCFLNRARAYMQSERYDLALADLNTSIQNNANSPDAYIMRVLVYGALRDRAGAMKDADKLVNQWGSSAAAHRMRGYALEDTNDFAGASSEYKTAAYLYKKEHDDMGVMEMISNVDRLKDRIGTAYTPAASTTSGAASEDSMPEAQPIRQ